MISFYPTKGLIKACKISKNAPQLTHMFFADDSIFFFEVDHTNPSRSAWVYMNMLWGRELTIQSRQYSLARTPSHQLRRGFVKYSKFNKLMIMASVHTNLLS